VRGEFVDVGGARLYYYAAGTRGTGEPVVMVHGFPTSSHLWSGVVPHVTAGHRIVVPDLLGFGRSDPPAQAGAAADVSVRGHARRLVALLDALGIDRACLVAHGVGAAIVLAVADQAPARVTRLCLLNPVTSVSWPGADAGLARASIPVAALLPLPVLLRVLRRRVDHAHANRGRFAHSADHFLRPFAAPGGRSVLLSHLRALTARATFPPVPSDLALPIAIVAGAHDPVVPPDSAQALRQALPGARLDVVAGGHFSPEESPEQVAAALGRLLAVDEGTVAAGGA
jgi:pimeloyl-ACP methyl ester carboxylesterase